MLQEFFQRLYAEDDEPLVENEEDYVRRISFLVGSAIIMIVLLALWGDFSNPKKPKPSPIKESHAQSDSRR